MEKRYVNTNELCNIYGVSRQAVEKWRKDSLPYLRLGAKSIRYDLEEVDQYFRNKGSLRAKKGE